jgi:hypothetical protein
MWLPDKIAINLNEWHRCFSYNSILHEIHCHLSSVSVSCLISFLIITVSHLLNKPMQQELVAPHIVKKFSSFYGIQRFITLHDFMFITLFTRASYSQDSISLKSTLILSSHLRLDLQNNLFLSGFSTKVSYAVYIHPMHVTWPTHLVLLALISVIIFGEE